MAVSLEQSRKRERGLEEEGRRLAEERADTLRLLKELQGEEQAVGGREDKYHMICTDGNYVQILVDTGLNQCSSVDAVLLINLELETFHIHYLSGQVIMST